MIEYLARLFSDPSFMGALLGALIAAFVPIILFLIERNGRIKENEFHNYIALIKNLERYNEDYQEIIKLGEYIIKKINNIDVDSANMYFLDEDKQDIYTDPNSLINSIPKYEQKLKVIKTNSLSDKDIPKAEFKTFLKFHERSEKVFISFKSISVGNRLLAISGQRGSQIENFIDIKENVQNMNDIINAILIVYEKKKHITN